MDKSPIHGVGIFASEDIAPLRKIGLAILFTNKGFHITKGFGALINHRNKPNDNCYLKRIGKRMYVVSKRFIVEGDEILLDYNDNPSYLRKAERNYK